MRSLNSKLLKELREQGDLSGKFFENEADFLDVAPPAPGPFPRAVIGPEQGKQVVSNAMELMQLAVEVDQGGQHPWPQLVESPEGRPGHLEHFPIRGDSIGAAEIAVNQPLDVVNEFRLAILPLEVFGEAVPRDLQNVGRRMMDRVRRIAGGDDYPEDRRVHDLFDVMRIRPTVTGLGPKVDDQPRPELLKGSAQLGLPTIVGDRERESYETMKGGAEPGSPSTRIVAIAGVDHGGILLSGKDQRNRADTMTESGERFRNTRTTCTKTSVERLESARPATRRSRGCGASIVIG